jgi:hypothetical protein
LIFNQLINYFYIMISFVTIYNQKIPELTICIIDHI